MRGADFRRVILLGPLHRLIPVGRLGPFMTPMEDAYRTPLGDVPLDRAFITELGRRVTLTPVHGDEEHSLEIELPFLQVALDRFSLVPIMLGEHISEPGASARLEALAAVLAELSDERTLLVASTDLSHMDNYADVVRTDRRLVDLVGAFDVDGLAQALAAGDVHVCGATGLMVVFKAAQRRGAARCAGVVLHLIGRCNRQQASRHVYRRLSCGRGIRVRAHALRRCLRQHAARQAGGGGGADDDGEFDPLGQAFTYAVPDRLAGRLKPGHLAWVPFRGRRLQAVVLKLGDVSPEFATHEIISLVWAQPLLTPAQIALAYWISDTYLAPLIESLRLMLPVRSQPTRAHGARLAPRSLLRPI